MKDISEVLLITNVPWLSLNSQMTKYLASKCQYFLCHCDNPVFRSHWKGLWHETDEKEINDHPRMSCNSILFIFAKTKKSPKLITYLSTSGYGHEKTKESITSKRMRISFHKIWGRNTVFSQSDWFPECTVRSPNRGDCWSLTYPKGSHFLMLF